MTALQKFKDAMAALPLVAILRGVRPDEAVAIGQALFDSGFRILEVPLNSPDHLRSIAALVQAFPQALVGAGTVLTRDEVRQVHAAGAQLAVSPNIDADVVRESVQLGMVSLPGVLSPSEAFAALAAGAHGLKLFPAEMIAPAAVKALRAVLPPGTVLLPVGGITPLNLAAYQAAGASGLGIGSALYQPGLSPASVRSRANDFVAAWAGTIHA